MYLLLVNLYEFGQFLRILLWICVPVFIVAMLVTTWLHYRRRRKTEDGMALLMEGLDLSAAPDVLIAAMKRRPALAMHAGEPMLASDASPVSAGNLESPIAADEGFAGGGEAGPASEDEAGPAAEGEREVITPEDAIDNMYKGILWMKEKYEQYRDMADQRIEQLKEQVARIEKKYEDLLTSRVDQRIETVPAIKDELPIKDESLLQQQLAAKDKQIEELVAKLQNSSQLLLNLSHELDKTVQPPQPQA